MGFLDYFKRKKLNENITTQVENNYKDITTQVENNYKDITYNEEQKTILEQEIESFFPEQGVWKSSCYNRPNDYCYVNLPCHLRDNNWMAGLLLTNLHSKGVTMPWDIIEEFMNNSERFNELRHNYELKIVRWQINYMKNGGEGWLIPRPYNEISLMFHPNVVEIFRAGIVKTLNAIGMGNEIVEEGIEKNADMFRDEYIRKGFARTFEPVSYHLPNERRYNTIEPADEEHINNWMKAKRYEYYLAHKDSIDKYGNPHPDMLITPDEVNELYATLYKQNEEREKVISSIKENNLLNLFYDNLNKPSTDVTSQDESTLSKE